MPELTTFWNTPAWTMSTEAFFYLFFPSDLLETPAPHMALEVTRVADFVFVGLRVYFSRRFTRLFSPMAILTLTLLRTARGCGR